MSRSKEKEEQWGLVCRVEAEKLQRAGEASFIVWSVLLFVGFLLRCGFCGRVTHSTLLSLTVLLQTLLYSIPLVLAGKPLVSALTAWLVSIQDRGVALILLLVPFPASSDPQTVVLCLHLQLCVLSSLRALGLSISWVRVFPLQQHATLANALLVNAAVLLALLPATLHFLTLLFRDAFDSTALLTLLLRFERGRFLSHVTDYAGLQSLLLLLTLASVLAVGTGSLCRACRSWKRRETEETAVVVSGEPPSSRSSPSSWRRLLQGLKKKEDLDATLRLEWARLCMMVEACLCLLFHLSSVALQQSKLPSLSIQQIPSHEQCMSLLTQAKQIPYTQTQKKTRILQTNTQVTNGNALFHENHARIQNGRHDHLLGRQPEVLLLVLLQQMQVVREGQEHRMLPLTHPLRAYSQVDVEDPLLGVVDLPHHAQQELVDLAPHRHVLRLRLTHALCQHVVLHAAQVVNRQRGLGLVQHAVRRAVRPAQQHLLLPPLVLHQQVLHRYASRPRAAPTVLLHQRALYARDLAQLVVVQPAQQVAYASRRGRSSTGGEQREEGAAPPAAAVEEEEVEEAAHVAVPVAKEAEEVGEEHVHNELRWSPRRGATSERWCAWKRSMLLYRKTKARFRI